MSDDTSTMRTVDRKRMEFEQISASALATVAAETAARKAKTERLRELRKASIMRGQSSAALR